MFIQTEATPNPETLKFLPGRPVMGARPPVDFSDAEAAGSASPLAGALLQVDGVKGIFLGSDFVSITKAEDVEWYVLKPALLGIIMEHFVADRPVLLETTAAAGAESNAVTPRYQPEDEETVTMIKELLDTRVRPAVAQDGGDIVFHGYDRGIVYLTMRGACAGCPSSTATLKMGIENMLRHYIPEIVEVRPAA